MSLPMTQCPIIFDDGIPEEFWWMVFTSRIAAWPRLRALASRHGVTYAEGRVGWITKRFVFRGNPASLNAFAQALWDDEWLGHVFRQEVEARAKR